MGGFAVFNLDSAYRDSFETGKFIPPSDICARLADSWLKSLEAKVNPKIYSAPSLRQHYFSDIDKLLIDAAKSYFRYFSSLLAHSQSVITLANADSIVIYQDRYPQFAKYNGLMEKHNYSIGADWSEKAVGTNGVSMAIELKDSVLVCGTDHYSYAFHPYSCAGSPIFNLSNGEVLGVLIISSLKEDLNVHSLGMGAAMARLIESEVNNRLNSLRDGSKIFNQTKKSLPIIKSNRTGTEIVGENALFRAALKDIEKTANTQLNLFLGGETGSGKEICARYTHDTSNRAQAPFVAVNCAAIPKDLVASELFGYTDGAFTGASRRGYPGRFEQANGGTIFLDEIGDAPYEVQVGLLRVLEEKKVYRLGSTQGIPVDVRVISATSRDLRDMIKKKLFREDLYYRLTGVIIGIPPLRERGEDLILLAEHFLNKYTKESSRELTFDTKTKQRMLEYKWPGNIRELKNVVERMAALTEIELLTEDLFLRCVPRKSELCNIYNESDEDVLIKELKEANGRDVPVMARAVKDSIDKDVLIKAIKETNGNITRVAEILSISRPAVYSRMRKYGLIS